MGTPPTASIELVDRYWAEWLGCTVPDLRPTSTRVHAHGPGLADYDGTFVLLAGGAPVISLPPALVPALEPVARRWSAEQVRDPVALAAAHLPVRDVARVVGPAWVGYADAGTLAAPAGVRARLLTGADASAVAALRAACAPEEWEHGGHALEEGTATGAFTRAATGALLAALAGYTCWGNRLAHISVVTHPAHRGRGFGRAVVAGAASHALEAGLVPQYRTLEANAAARALAASVGFAAHLTTVAVPYRVAQPRPAHGVAR
jgi:GNAT superfamily N-acetyltransferase